MRKNISVRGLGGTGHSEVFGLMLAYHRARYTNNSSCGSNPHRHNRVHVPQTADKYGDALKIVQIGFYIVAAIVAILTYRAAAGAFKYCECRIPKAGDGSSAQVV